MFIKFLLVSTLGSLLKMLSPSYKTYVNGVGNACSTVYAHRVHSSTVCAQHDVCTVAVYALHSNPVTVVLPTARRTD